MDPLDSARCAGQISLAARSREPIDRTAKHEPRHLPMMLVEKARSGGDRTLADLAQHPADRAMDEGLLVVKQHSSDAERVAEVAGPDEGQGSHDRDAPLRKMLRRRQLE